MPSPPAVSDDDALELLHFAFRTITRGPDRLLARRRLGRVHHRLLYMCRRHPGVTVGEIGRVLGISKQALHRPLGDLVRARLVELRPDEADRRIRRVTLTARGRALEHALSAPQRRAFATAFASVGVHGARAWAAVMASVGDDTTAAGILAQARAATPVSASPHPRARRAGRATRRA